MKDITQLADRINEIRDDSNRLEEWRELCDRFNEMLDERYREQLDKARNDSEIRYWVVRQEIERMYLIQSHSRFLVADEPLDYQMINSEGSEPDVAHVVHDWRTDEPYCADCRNVDQSGLLGLLILDAARYEVDHPEFFDYWERRPFSVSE